MAANVVVLHQMAFIFGILGSAVSFLVYLAPLPTFHTIVKKKSTEGFQSIPYSVALFSAMLMLYYAFLKTRNAFMLITINSIGCAIEALYLTIYVIYAKGTAKTFTTKLLGMFNVGAYGLILVSTYFIPSDSLKLTIVGWINVVFSVSVFAAPLSIMRLVVKTKSVKYMPFSLSFCLTLCAVMWFCYGFLIYDFYVAAPNILGFAFGIAQMILYIIYRNAKKPVVLPEVVQLPKEEETKNIIVTVNGDTLTDQGGRAIDRTETGELHDRQQVVDKTSNEGVVSSSNVVCY